MRLVCVAAIVAAIGPWSSTSLVAAEDTSEAQQLFEDGRKLLEAGKTDQACEKFEQSISKDPRAVGTLLNLGLCNERRGKVATALRLFQEAFDRAGDANLPQHREAAQGHIAKLIPQIPVLVITVASPVTGESVFVDDAGVKLGKVELQLDPGPHKVVATAPGRLPYEKTVKLAVGDRMDVAIPMLEVPTTVVVGGGSPRRLIGKIATISGGGLVLAAGVMSIYAYRTYQQQFDGGDAANCTKLDDGSRLCNDAGQDATNRARNVATGASVVGAIGGAALVGGIILWLTAPSEGKPSTTALVPTASAGGAALWLTGRF